MKMNIRPAHHEDADAITAMLTRLASEIGDREVFLSDVETIARYGFGEQNLFHCLIAESGEKHQGLALFYPVFSTMRGKPGVYVQDLWVDESARGQGLGARLLAGVAGQAASQWEAAYLKLTVYADNSNANAFYRRLGFRGDERDRPMAIVDDAFQKLRDQA